MKFNCGAERHHYSMFNVGRSMFDVQSVRSVGGGQVLACSGLALYLSKQTGNAPMTFVL
jgi:hypothetical protein